jgi:clan AA aspartic protease
VPAVTARGEVNTRLEAILRLRIRGPAGVEAEFDAVIDTGYSGLLTLPAAAAEALKLERGMGGRATLADGSARRFDTFAAELEWGGGWRSVVVSALGTEVLVGMRLLAGHGLWVEVTASGAVEVTELPPKANASGAVAHPPGVANG